MTNKRRHVMPAVIIALSIVTAGAVGAHEAHRLARQAAADSRQAEELMATAAAAASQADSNPTGMAPAPNMVADSSVAVPPTEQPGRHEHAEPEDAAEGFMVRLGRLHPAVVHFPIALILMVALAEFLNLLRPSVLFDSASRFMLVMAAVTAPPTAALGWLFAQGETYVGPAAFYFEWHQILGIGVVPLTLLALFIRWRYGASTAGRKAYGVVLVLLTIVVAVTGHFGGTLTHGIGHFNIF